VVHLSIMSGAALIPVVLFCLDRMLTAPAGRPDRRLRWLAATAVALALQGLAGHPQMPVYTALAAFVYALVRGVESAVGARRWRALVAGPLLLVAAYVLGYALAAVQLVPWIDLARLSVRAAGVDYGFVFATSTTGREWLLFIFPYLLGAPGKSLFTSGPTEIAATVRAWEHSGYVGVLPLALAAIALWHLGELVLRSRGGEALLQSHGHASIVRRRYSLVFLVVLVGIGVTLAAGSNTPLAALVYRTPVLGSLRAVERGLVLASFALAVMAGFGMQRIVESPERRAPFAVAAAGLVGVFALAVWRQHLPLSSPIAHVPVVFAGCSALLLLWWSWRPSGAVTRSLAAALVMCDMGLYAVSFNATASRAIYRYVPTSQGVMRGNGEPFRKATVLLETNDVSTRVAQEAMALSWGMVYGVEDVNGFNSLQTRRYTDYLFGPQQNDVSYGYLRNPALLGSDSPVLSSLNVRYVLVPRDERPALGSHLQLVFADASVRVYENTRAYPRAYFPEHVRTELDPRVVLRQVTAPGFDGRREALVESVGLPETGPPTAEAWCKAKRVSPNELQVRTLTAEPRLLVVSEMDMPGWRAEVDGVPATIHRTNYLFRGVFVPEGHHVVRFVYRPRAIMVGAAVSALALVALGLLLVGRPFLNWRRSNC
jgi:hypothetical protein